MSKDQFGFDNIRTQTEAKQAAQRINDYLYETGQYDKNKANQLLNSMYSQLAAPQTSPLSKCMTLHVLKELTYMADVKIFSLLCGHPVFQFLVSEAKNNDPRKPVKEKGSNLFSTPMPGNQYMRLILQLIKFWGQRFAKGKNSQPTKYKKAFADLKNSDVTFPENYQIIVQSQFKPKMKTSKSPASLTQTLPPPSKPRQTPSGEIKNGKIDSDLRLLKNKIDFYIQYLQEAEDSITMKQLINKHTKQFQQTWPRLQVRMQQIGQDSSLILYSQLNYFFAQAKKYYDHYIPQNDFGGYFTQIKITYQKCFQQKRMKKSSKMQQQTSSKDMSKQQKMGLINSFYTKIQQRSQSPGFKSIKNQIQNEKQLMRKTTMRSTSRSPRNINRSRPLNVSSTSNLRQSKINPIFSSPPNPRIGGKNFQGQTIYQNKQLARAIYNIKKQQGIRRFKISNFRQKNPLFENDQLQIGYKSEPVFEQIENFDHFIMLSIFIGNKTQEGINNFQVEYKGDNNQLLYANPRSVDSIIPAGYQNKHELMITPIKVPFGFITMEISYKFKSTGYMTSIVLPNSVLKFTSYMKISRTQFQKSWNSSRKFKTNQFRLCKYIAPDTFTKWISVLESITKYSQFSRQGSETDLQMFCGLIMLQKYEAVLKINVRPNLQVVIQLGAMDNNPEGVQYFKFYLQTLELVLKEIDI